MPLVKLFGNLRTLARASEVQVSGERVGEVLANLIAQHPALEAAVLEGGALRPHVRVMVAGRDVELAQGLETPLAADAELAVFPPIAGGQGVPQL